MSETAGSPKHGGNAFLFVIVCVTLDMLAFGMIIPVMPDLLVELTHLPVEKAVAWAGPLTATFALTNFLAMPTLGGLSDRFGRRPVLLVSMATLAVDFVIMGLASALWVLFLGRFLSGISSATYSTANAYIADTTTPEKRGQAFGMIGAAFGIGFVLGPAIGGLIGQIDSRAPFYAAAVVAALNVLYGLFVLPESLKPESRRSFDVARSNPLGAFAHFSKLPKVAWFLVGLVFAALAHTVYPSTWSFHGEIRYDWGAREIGLSLAAVGVSSALVQIALMGPILKWLGTVRTLVWGLLINIVSFTAFAFADAAWFALAIIPFSALGGVAGPANNTIMSNLTPENAQGELHGATASINALAMIISPLIMTQTLYSFASGITPVYFPGAAFLLAAVLTGLALIPVSAGIRANREQTSQIA